MPRRAPFRYALAPDRALVFQQSLTSAHILVRIDETVPRAGWTVTAEELGDAIEAARARFPHYPYTKPRTPCLPHTPSHAPTATEREEST